jgi:subtilisin family serine protease
MVIAAAGNEAGYGEYGPLLPGGWETELAPDSARCTALGVPGGGRKPGYHPLVFSVSGVEPNEDALANARPGALPRMVSAGAHVNVETDAPTLTGTSTSTAALAGAAALLWSRFPNLDAPTVMSYLYDTARPIGLDSNYQLGASPQPVRQLDVCQAMVEACSDRPGCTAQLVCDGPSDLLDHVAELGLANDGIVGTPSAPLFAAGVCGGGVMDLYSATGTLACPTPVDPDLAYTSPQPTQPACPNCTIKKSTGVVTAALDPAYASDDVVAVDVEVIASGRSSYYSLGDPGLTSAGVLDISLNPIPPGYDSATISITFASSPRAQVNPLLIVQ